MFFLKWHMQTIKVWVKVERTKTLKVVFLPTFDLQYFTSLCTYRFVEDKWLVLRNALHWNFHSDFKWISAGNIRKLGKKKKKRFSKEQKIIFDKK